MFEYVQEFHNCFLQIRVKVASTRIWAKIACAFGFMATNLHLSCLFGKFSLKKKSRFIFFPLSKLARGWYTYARLSVKNKVGVPTKCIILKTSSLCIARLLPKANTCLLDALKWCDKFLMFGLLNANFGFQWYH